jgi:general secretion pathway protein F
MRVQLQVVQGRNAPQSIELEAATLSDARQRALDQGYAVLSQRPARATLAGWLAAPIERHADLSRTDVTVFVEQLRDLLAAGLSVIEALSTLQQSADAWRRARFDALIRRLRGGESLSQALAAQAHYPPLLTALVSASELTSDLPQALTRYIEHEQQVTELRHRITSVAIYPLLLTAVGGAVLLFLLLYVMPRFARVFEGMNDALPWSARAMVGWAHWLQAHGVWLGLAAVLAGLFLAALLGSRPLRDRALQRLLQWSPLRQRLRTYFLARWYRTGGMLVQGGIPLPEALALSSSVLPAGLQAGGYATERALRDGLSPAQAHALAGMSTPVAEQLMRAGERTGDLGTVLTRIAQFHESEVARMLERGMRSLEPIVMVLIGVGVGTVVVLMYLPIFELASAIQ